MSWEISQWQRRESEVPEKKTQGKVACTFYVVGIFTEMVSRYDELFKLTEECAPSSVTETAARLRGLYIYGPYLLIMVLDMGFQPCST